MKKSVRFITRSAIIAALYFALSVAFDAIAFGPVQFRISETLTLLPVILPEAVPGLAIGCLFTNFFLSPYGIYDALIGTFATLTAAILTRAFRKNILAAAIPPIVLNALFVPLIWLINGTDFIYFAAMSQILLSQFIVCGVLGVPLTLVIKKAFIRARLISADSASTPNAPPYVRTERGDAKKKSDD